MSINELNDKIEKIIINDDNKEYDNNELKKKEVVEEKEKEVIPNDNIKSQSSALSDRIKEMSLKGRHFTDDSIISEKNLNKAINKVLIYAKNKLKIIDGDIIHKKTISLYECQEYFYKIGGPKPNEENKKVYMKPDGGIFFAKVKDNITPILIVEDKVQGTNDKLFTENKNRQATGNAIERGAKNIRGAEMIFSSMNIFPYVLFASGCDFHYSETISKRLEMMNMGYPNHYIDINSKQNDEDIDKNIENELNNIKIKKHNNICIASIFIKAHKWNDMEHNSSLWKIEEYEKVCCKIIDMVLYELFNI